MNIYANALTEEAIRRDFYYAFADARYPGVPEMNMTTIDESFFFVGDIPVQPIQVMHHKMPVFGFRFGDFTYITDANKIEDQRKRKNKRIKSIGVKCASQRNTCVAFYFVGCSEYGNELEVPEVYFTHISHQLGKHEDINRELPPHIRLAYDGLKICL
jgi:phosphoribosyl 1,2-cyclic phosphate phosphodiesterase